MPPGSGTLAASGSTSADERISPSPSRSHCTTAPATNTLPSSAYSRAPAADAAAVVISPWAESIRSPPVCRSMKQPVP